MPGDESEIVPSRSSRTWVGSHQVAIFSRTVDVDVGADGESGSGAARCTVSRVGVGGEAAVGRAAGRARGPRLVGAGRRRAASLPASGDPSGTTYSCMRNSSERSCITTSMNSATWGRATNDAMRAAPSSWGFTTRSAPALANLGTLSSWRARATTNSPGTIARADSVTNRFSASPSSAAISA